jgi:hypothetical protein
VLLQRLLLFQTACWGIRANLLLLLLLLLLLYVQHVRLYVSGDHACLQTSARCCSSGSWDRCTLLVLLICGCSSM